MTISDPFDDAATPDQRLRVMADQLEAMIATGEAWTPAGRLILAQLPDALRDIVVETYALRAPAEVVRLRPALILIEGGKP